VWHFLALNVGSNSRTVELRGTLKDLAAELGLTHEVLYRTLAALSAQSFFMPAQASINVLMRFCSGSERCLSR
jgi:hypothetical protein